MILSNRTTTTFWQDTTELLMEALLPDDHLEGGILQQIKLRRLLDVEYEQNMDAKPVGVEEMSKLIDSLRKKKAPGPDRTMAEMLLQTKVEISPFLELLINKSLTQGSKPSSWNHNSQWLLNSDNNQLNLVVLGIDGLSEELADEIRVQCDEDEYEIDCQLYSVDYRIIDGDVSLPQNSFKTPDFSPNGCFCVYSNPDGFEYVRDSLEKTLLSNLEQDDRLPFQGLPIVILFVVDLALDKDDMMRLGEEGQNLADSLQCPFIDVSTKENATGKRFNASLIAEALGQLIQSIHHRAGFLNVYQSVMDSSQPDIR
uniref:(California timema) hypothetical protein n=1 Tax=Timema californicum TaxID=61474 RepID=A0A7R9JEN0_TIMCA|nr:unnamed protein product [Timema californicum]